MIMVSSKKHLALEIDFTNILKITYTENSQDILLETKKRFKLTTSPNIEQQSNNKHTQKKVITKK